MWGLCAHVLGVFGGCFEGVLLVSGERLVVSGDYLDSGVSNSGGVLQKSHVGCGT